MILPYLRRRTLAHSHWYMGHLSSGLATHDDTGGALTVLEVNMRPGMEPPAHVHSREAEAIFVLDGGIEGWAGNRRISAGPGEIANLPNGEPHGWKVTAGADGKSIRGLLILAPSGLESFFERYSVPAQSLELPEVDVNQYAIDMQQNVGKMIADGAEFGIQWMPPDYTPALDDAPVFAKPCLHVLGEHFEPLALAVETGGSFTAMIWHSPVESQMPKHRHNTADEAFYVLDGEVAITAGERFSVIARPGDFVFLPKGLPHTHRSHGGKPSRALQIVTPGGVETALAEVAALAPHEITIERLMEIAERGQITLLPE